tara:strand:+ start:67 stop:366 length:300 start_codon:yes stop_codon:yes gene_type:complete
MVKIAGGRPESVGNIPYRGTLVKMAEKHGDQMRPTVESLTAFICLFFFDQLLENWTVNLFNNLRKQRNITHERSEVLVQTQSNYFGQKIGPLIFYLGRY